MNRLVRRPVYPPIPSNGVDGWFLYPQTLRGWPDTSFPVTDTGPVSRRPVLTQRNHPPSPQEEVPILLGWENVRLLPSLIRLRPRSPSEFYRLDPFLSRGFETFLEKRRTRVWEESGTETFGNETLESRMSVPPGNDKGGGPPYKNLTKYRLTKPTIFLQSKILFWAPNFLWSLRDTSPLSFVGLDPPTSVPLFHWVEKTKTEVETFFYENPEVVGTRPLNPRPGVSWYVEVRTVHL